MALDVGAPARASRPAASHSMTSLIGPLSPVAPAGAPEFPPPPLRCRAMAGGRIYSVGYEGLTVAGLVERLQQSRIEEVDAAMARMRDHLASGEPAEAVARLAALADGRRIAVLCLESDQTRCHRREVLA